MTIRPISRLYVDIVKRVALGLSIEDGEEMARGLSCIRPHERFTTHILGSAWLCYVFMLAWFWAPIYLEMWRDQGPDLQRISDYERNLQEGVRALPIWKVCRRNVGIIVAFPKKSARVIGDLPPPHDGWSLGETAMAASVLFLLGVGIPHGHGLIQFAAFVPFYLNSAASGASDLNSGSTTAAPTHTYGGGTFVRATNTYTVASGNPSTDGFVAAGDYVSVYTTTGRTVATFVMKVDSTTSTTIVGSASGVVYGVNTTVSETANASTLTIGGSWATPLPLGATASAGGLGTFTIPQSTKVNITSNQTLGASITMSMAGATTTPLWFSGYSANPGDLDADTTNALAKPIWTLNATFVVTASGAHQLWSSLSLVGNRTGTILTFTGTVPSAVRLRSSNTSSNAGAIGMTCGATSTRVAYTWVKAPTTATTTGVVQVNAASVICLGMVADTGGIAGFTSGTNAVVYIWCVGLNNVGAGFLAGTGTIVACGCTVYGATVDGIKWTGSPTASTIASCLFSGLNGSTATTNGINNALGTNVNTVLRACNDYYNVTNPEVGFGDSFAFFPQLDTNPVVTSATNMTPIPTSNARNNGFPGIFENETFNGYAWIGAVQPNAFGSGFFIQ